MGDGAPERRLAAILSADVADYTRLMAEDEAATVSALNACRERIAVVIDQHGGRLVDFVGDNFLAEFPTATGALACAVEAQHALDQCNGAVPADRRLDFRMGIHVGEIRAEGDRIFGTGVNAASRLEGQAEPGGICVSRSVREQVGKTPGFAFQDLGEQRLKNLPEPVHVFRVHWVEPSEEGPRPDSGAAEVPSIAVLPFENMSADPDQVYFADGIAEELINALTRVEGLRVVARTSAFSFRGTQADIATIGRKLGVSAVVDGSVRKAAERLRISAQLIDTRSGHHLWSEVYDRPLDDVFQIQDEIARTIVTTIKPRLLGGAPALLVKRGTESQAAYDLYLRAAERLARLDRWDTRTAIAMLEDATRIDPDYADGWARLGVSCCQMEAAFEPAPRWGEQAERALGRAFELDPENAEAHIGHGRVLWSPRRGFCHREALSALDEALRLQPGSYQALVWRSMILFHVGLLDDALRGLREANSMQPDDAYAMNLLGQVLLYQGKIGESGECLERSLRADATHLYSHLFSPYQRICFEDLPGAEQALQQARQVVGEDAMLDANEALLWAKRGERTRAESLLWQAGERKRSISHLHHVWHHSAAACAVLGESSRAVELVRRSADSGFPNEPVFRKDAHLGSVQDDPEMKNLMSELRQRHGEMRREFGGAVDND